MALDEIKEEEKPEGEPDSLNDGNEADEDTPEGEPVSDETPNEE